jgi:hypothetical protein
MNYEVVTVLTALGERVELAGYKCADRREVSRVVATLLEDLDESDGDVEIVVRYIGR